MKFLVLFVLRVLCGTLLVPSSGALSTAPMLSLRPITRLYISTSALPSEETAQPQPQPGKRTTIGLSPAAKWHQQRRKSMIQKYGDQILQLEQQSSQNVGLPLLLLGNATLLLLSIWSGSLPILAVIALAIFPGSMFSLWQLQILHDCIHGTLVKRTWQQPVLFWGSMPSMFGYFLYLKYGHLTHHKSVGDATLLQLFDSSQTDFEDGDILFVSHRMNLKGEIGPQIPLGEKRMTLSISRSGFHFWKSQQPIWNAVMFSLSFLFERYMLCWNEVVVALTGRNFFFPNKPDEFHQQCATYTRCAVALRFFLFLVAGWKSLLFLYLSETIWSIPPHPACAMFITNHGSKGGIEECQPTSSTYAGGWYSFLTLGTNYHCEHHDFPSIPFHLLGRLHEIAPEFYKASSEKDNVFGIMKETFGEPDFYACSNANQLQHYE